MAQPAKRRTSLERARQTIQTWLPPLLLFAFGLALWQGAVIVFHMPLYVLPTPSAIGEVMWAKGPELVRHVNWTMIEAVGGFMLGSTVAFGLAVGFVHVRLLERTTYPWAIIIETIPIIAIAPLLTIWFGFGVAPKVIIAAIVCFFPMLVNATRGLRAISPQALELMRILSASRWQIFTRLRLPSALPYLFAGLKVASTLSVIGAIVGEFTGADRGIGYIVVSAGYRMDTRLLFAGIAFSSAAGVLFFVIISLIERALLYWPGARLED